jgi:hypothetical protein
MYQHLADHRSRQCGWLLFGSRITILCPSSNTIRFSSRFAVPRLGILMDFYSNAVLWNFFGAYLLLRAIFLVISLALVRLDRSKGIGDIAVYWLSFTWISTGMGTTQKSKHNRLLVLSENLTLLLPFPLFRSSDPWSSNLSRCVW